MAMLYKIEQQQKRLALCLWYKKITGMVIHLPFEYKDYCPVELAFSILTRAQLLSRTKPDDALCVYKDTDGEISLSYLTGDGVTKYYSLVVKLVIPNIFDVELKLISTHSIRVTACVLLHEAGKDSTYIKLRLRWLSVAEIQKISKLSMLKLWIVCTSGWLKLLHRLLAKTILSLLKEISICKWMTWKMRIKFV